jgi:hypothetical protein
VANVFASDSAGLDPEQADAMLEVELVGIVSKAAETDWRAARWLLERRFPERWGTQRVRRDQQPPRFDGPNPFAEFDELAERRHHPPDSR